MAISVDWAMEAADEIAGEVYETSGPGTGIHVTEMRAIIVKHCPMKEDVAYMPVPRCDQCRYWGGFPDGNGRDQCTNYAISPHQNDELMTTADFGCVQHESK